MAFHRRESSDAEPLLHAHGAQYSPNQTRNAGCCNQQRCYKVRIFTLLLWNAIVSGMFTVMIVEIVGGHLRTHQGPYLSPYLGFFILLGTVQVLFPVGGLLADICCGRYKMIALSILVFWFDAIFLSVFGIYSSMETPTGNMIVLVTSIFAYIIFIIGFSGFRSNSIQFSLDQLLDASSEEISIFLHWSVWTGCVGDMVVRLIITASLGCLKGATLDERLLRAFSFAVCLIIITASVVLTYCIRNSFYRERISSNPYWNVWKVLRFAAKHGKPLGHRSAFTYSDDRKPPRLDFAKMRYGGPFKTEVVEDVKTFLRVVVIMIATAPIFMLEIPVSYLFPLFGLYLGENVTSHTSCTYDWMLFESGNLSSIISVLAIPVYLLLVYPFIKKWVPPIITRLGIGVTLMVASIISMLIIQAVANHYSLENGSVNNTCLFLEKYPTHNHFYTYEFPTQVLVITNVLYGIAAPLISITVYEFISAQSPHTMKGLLLGVFYAFKGLFITLGSILTFPFAQETLWGDQHGLFDCGFYYYLSYSVFGVLGLVVFILAARWYRYRERDDPPYRHQYAEDYYSRYTSQPTRRLIDGHGLHDSYGTMED